jgi:hypothetical protein
LEKLKVDQETRMARFNLSAQTLTNQIKECNGGERVVLVNKDGKTTTFNCPDFVGDAVVAAFNDIYGDQIKIDRGTLISVPDSTAKAFIPDTVKTAPAPAAATVRKARTTTPAVKSSGTPPAAAAKPIADESCKKCIQGTATPAPVNPFFAPPAVKAPAQGAPASGKSKPPADDAASYQLEEFTYDM